MDILTTDKMDMQNTKDIYICYTIYHLLLSLVYSSVMKERQSRIIISTRIENAEVYHEKIEHYYPMIEVKVLDDEKFKRHGFVYSREVHRYYRSDIGEGRIHIYNDCTQIGHYLHRNKISYILMEDGLNCMQHPLSIPKWTWKTKVVNYLKNIPKWHGFSPYCISIIVNEIAGIPRDSRYSKFVEQPKKELFSRLDIEERKKLLAVFDVQPLVVQEPAVLILTQPLELEFPDIAKKREFWKSLIDKYRAENYHVYVKVHPRDTLDYTSFPVSILPKNVPAELLDFVVDKTFAIGITYYSTALEYMGCVREKIYLAWER